MKWCWMAALIGGQQVPIVPYSVLRSTRCAATEPCCQLQLNDLGCSYVTLVSEEAMS